MPLMDNLKRFMRGEEYDDEENIYEQEESENNTEYDGSATTRWKAVERSEEPVAEASAPAASTASAASAASSYSGSFSSYMRSETEKGRVVMNNAAQLSVVLVTPDRYATAGEIAKHLLEKRTIVLNMEQTNREVARRLLDFLGGVAYAQNGKVKRVANATFIITPSNVELEGELAEGQGEAVEEIISND